MLVKRFQERADQRDMQRQALHWLHRTPLFQDADPEFLRHVSQNMRPTTIHKGEVLILQGDPGEEMHILRSGALDLYVAEDQPQHDTPESYGQKIYELEVGALVGEFHLVFQRPNYMATVVATQRSDLFTLADGQFLSLLDQFPKEEVRIKKMAEQKLRCDHTHLKHG